MCIIRAHLICLCSDTATFSQGEVCSRWHSARRQSQRVVVRSRAASHEKEFNYLARGWLFRAGTSGMLDLGEVHVHRA